KVYVFPFPNALLVVKIPETRYHFDIVTGRKGGLFHFKIGFMGLLSEFDALSKEFNVRLAHQFLGGVLLGKGEREQWGQRTGQPGRGCRFYKGPSFHRFNLGFKVRRFFSLLGLLPVDWGSKRNASW